jgi:predicted esterase
MDEDVFALLLQKLLDRPLRFLFPRAPYPVQGLPGRRNAGSWYDYDGNQERFRSELVRTERLILDVVRGVEAERRLAPASRFILGFSQGGYCGAWVAIRNAGFFARLIVAGARVKTEFLAGEMARAAEQDFRVLLCHGSRDVSVRPEAAERSRAALAAAGIPVECRLFEEGHSIGRRVVTAIGEWLDSELAGRGVSD